jgi:uncharacterized FlaG/YvyC family protein
MKINGGGVSLQAMAAFKVERPSGERRGMALAPDLQDAAALNGATSDTAIPNAKTDGKQAVAQKKGVADKSPVVANAPGIGNRKAYFAVDDKKNVVIKIEDENGKVVRQIPPEEYLKMVDKIEQSAEKLFHTVA